MPDDYEFEDDDFDDGFDDDDFGSGDDLEGFQELGDEPDDDFDDEFSTGDEFATTDAGESDYDDELATLSMSKKDETETTGDFSPGELGASTVSDAELAWRETYFVLFRRDARPTLTQIEEALSEASDRLVIENLQADDDGLFQSVLVQAPQDNAALEISYEYGEAVIEQSAELAKMLQKQLDGDHLAALLSADARLDVLHFERLPEYLDFDDVDADEDPSLTGLDPATLIMVVEALAELTEGLPVDPAAGEVLV